MNTLPKGIAELSATKLSLLVQKIRTQTQGTELLNSDPIALIGVGCRFPGSANTPEAFWQIMEQGIDATTDIPSDRWDVEHYYDPSPDSPGKMYARRGGFVDQIQDFDPTFFGISPREAASLDPQHRVLLEVAWEALENSGIPPHQQKGSKTGVFVGITTTDYLQLQTGLGDLDLIDAYTNSGGALNFAAGRLSYLLGLQGPSLSVETACSSSLTALHLACQSLRTGESELALAGGVNLMVIPEMNIRLSQGKMLAADGRCKTFDAAADGFGRSEGCGVVVLKRLSKALADGDNIMAVIRGSAVNQDGASSGLTVPNGPAQQAVIRQALQNSAVEPHQVSYVEAHGTGTALGDPIELNALAGVYGQARSPQQPLWVGSVKTNIGHAEAGAGIAGVIKVALALQHEALPAHLHFQQPTPHLDWSKAALEVPTQLTPWTRSQQRRIAGVSSFGASGTNAHVILEEAPLPQPTAGPTRPQQLICLSATQPAALSQLAQQYLDNLPNLAGKSLGDIAHTAATGRTHFAHRLAIVAADHTQLETRLQAFLEGVPDRAVTTSLDVVPQGSQGPVFLFTGQGSQAVNMGRDLYDTQPSFRATLERCDEILSEFLPVSLLSVLYPDEAQDIDSSQGADTNALIDQTQYTQPALFALEYALAQLWISWGIRPAAVIGHSVGEYVAACLAGVFSLEEGLTLIAHRGRLMQQQPAGGGMTAAFATKEQIEPAIADMPSITIAAYNGETSLVLSGPLEALATLSEQLESQNIETRTLPVSHAFHSPLMAPMLADFKAVAQTLSFQPAQLPMISNITGQPVVPEEIAQPDYWVNHVLASVQFQPGMKTLHQQGYRTFIEIGPHPVLLGMGRRDWPEADDETTLWLTSLRRQRPDWQQLLESLGQLYAQGVEIDWAAFEKEYQQHRLVTLPTYPWQRERYWIADQAKPNRIRTLKNAHPLLGARLRSPIAETVVFERWINTAELPFIDDHRIYGLVVVPTVAYLEMALAAAHEVFGPGTCVLKEIAIREAFVLAEGEARQTQIVLTPDETGASFQVFSLGNPEHTEDWKLHASGHLLVEEERTPIEPVKTDWRAAHPEAIAHENFYPQLRELGLEFGPSFLGVTALWQSERELLAHIQLPEALRSEALAYHMHPAQLDACLQLFLACLPSTDEVFIPIGIDQLHFYGEPEETLFSHMQLHPTQADNAETFDVDVTIFTASGRRVAEFKRMHLKRAPKQALQRIAQSHLSEALYTLDWQPQPKPLTPTSTATGRWLILSDSKGLGTELATKLVTAGGDCLQIFVGDTYEQISEQQWRLNPERPEDFRRLLAEQESNWDGIVHLWGLETTETGQTTAQSLIQDQRLSCGSLLYLVQALQTLPVNPNRPRLWTVTQGAQAIVPRQEITGLAQTGLIGMMRSLQAEQPELAATLIEVDPLASLTSSAAAIQTEILTPEDGPADEQVAFRDGQRYVARISRQRQQAQAITKPVAIVPDGTYLVTGNFDTVQLGLMDWLIEQGAQQVVLMGIGRLSAQHQERLAAIHKTAVTVTIAEASCCDPAKIDGLLKELKASMPRLRGILHTAHHHADGPLLNQTWEQFQQALLPKLSGTWMLHELTASMPLDFFGVFASALGWLGSPGQGNYAAGNAFLDGLAAHRQSRGLPAVSLNWSPWRHQQNSKPQNSIVERWQAWGLEPVELARGAQLMSVLLAGDAPQVAIMPMQWHRFAPAMVEGEVRPFFSAVLTPTARANAQLKQQRDAKGKLREDLESLPTAQQPDCVFNCVLAAAAHVLRLNTDQIDPDKPLQALGMDSLMAVELRNLLVHQTASALPATLLFEYPSVEQLATYLTTLLTAPEVTTPEVQTIAEPPPPPLESEATDQADIDHLSDSELDALLADELARVQERLV